MKQFLFVLLLAGLTLGQAASQSTQSISLEEENARKAKRALDQAVQALGGQAYLSIQDITQEGRTYSFFHGQPNSVGLLFWRFYKFPDKDRIEFTKKRDVAYVYNGDQGSEITFKGPHPQDPKDLADYLRRRQYALDWVLRKWLVEPGVALFYEGPTVAEQKSVEQVTIMNARNQGVTLFLDASTHLPVKKSFSWRDPTDKQRNVEEEIYDGYRLVQGVMTPFSITRNYNGEMSNQRFLNSISYNKGLEESMFSLGTSATFPQAPKK